MLATDLIYTKIAVAARRRCDNIALAPTRTGALKTSITHHHICAVVNTEIDSGRDGPIRLLVVGSGNGQLMAFLQAELPRLRNGTEFEIHGFDVADSYVQAPSYFAESVQLLGERFPDIPWEGRISQITTKEAWPYPDGHFDFVVSNQVMEHVHDHDFVFGETRRVLKPDGISVHLFPLKYYLYETHLNLPFVHWISNKDVLFSYIKACNRIGFGKYREQFRRSGGKITRDEYARKHADYMIYETNYLKMREVFQCAKRRRMRCSFRYTGEFYRNKLRSIMHRPIRYHYSTKRHASVERLSLFFYMFVSSVTLVLEKENTYVRH